MPRDKLAEFLDLLGDYPSILIPFFQFTGGCVNRHVQLLLHVVVHRLTFLYHDSSPVVTRHRCRSCTKSTMPMFLRLEFVPLPRRPESFQMPRCTLPFLPSFQPELSHNQLCC